MRHLPKEAGVLLEGLLHGKRSFTFFSRKLSASADNVSALLKDDMQQLYWSRCMCDIGLVRL